MLEIQKLIKANPDNWVEILKSGPYSLKVSFLGDYDDRVMFNYIQGVSDYSEPIVREARGLILNKNTYEVICMGFTKFFLCDSPFVDNVDWDNIQVQEKLDGSLITLYWYNDKWVPATTGCIDAKFATMAQGCYTNFRELFEVASINSGLDYSKLDKNYCYMFELCSPYNKQVVTYKDIQITHIGTRDRISLRELNVDIGIKKPILYPIKNLNDAIVFVNKSNYMGEGFVAVDSNFHRIKIKSNKWFKWHYMLHNNSMNVPRALEILLKDDAEEFISRYPQYRTYFNDVKNAYMGVKIVASCVINYAKEMLKKYANRKDLANAWVEYVKLQTHEDNEQEDFIKKFKSTYFGRIDNNTYTVKDFLDGKFSNQLADMVEYLYQKKTHHKPTG